ncbi:MAG: type II toxin-antitoxin system VapC family toxin [Deltaproteobacteria bacterium]|nr:type II toxin-antitoxin system VapC family toxin [Deltaproteobacteria bacterium]
MERIYLDTSAYLGILLGEEEAERLQRLAEKKIFCSSVLLLIEAERNLVRLSREKVLKQEHYERAIGQLRRVHEDFLLRDFTVDLCLTGSFPAVRLPRSNDLVHIRTAQWFIQNGGLERFVTLDERQRGAALELGLPVQNGQDFK